MISIDRKFGLPVLLLSSLILNILALYQMVLPIYEAGVLLDSRRWMIMLLVNGSIILAGFGVTFYLARPEKLKTGDRWFEIGLDLLRRLQAFNLVLFGLLIVLLGVLSFGRYAHLAEKDWVRLFLFWLTTLSGTIFLKAYGFRRSWAELFGASLLITTFGYRIAVFLPDISTYPFSLGWSEASRYYYASLFFAERVYDQALAPTVLHPTRYMMQSLPFLVPDSPLWLHRLWQVILWISTTAVSAYLLVRRLDLGDQLRRWAIAAWVFVFILLGPVYYHLQITMILVLWGFDFAPNKKRFLKSLGVVLIASLWAGISRVNWFPVPAMLAATLYLLEEGVDEQPLWRYLLVPFVWGLSGVAAAFGAQAGYAFLSGNPLKQFASSFTSDLLWYRLLPNSTYGAGILPGTLLVSLPLFLLIYAHLRKRWHHYHPIRLLGIAAMLAVLFGGGLVVSVKIGGGSNLHNMDAYLVLLMVAAVYIFAGRFAPEDRKEGLQVQAPSPGLNRISMAALALSILVPVYLTFELTGTYAVPGPGQVDLALEKISSKAEKTAQSGGEVLFISERQLLTFNYVEDVPLIPDYERVFLMEMAMAGNPDYLGRFHQELKDHRFALIISEPQFMRIKDETEIFGEENNAWVTQVSQYLLCYYEPRKIMRNVRIQFFEPRESPRNCP